MHFNFHKSEIFFNLFFKFYSGSVLLNIILTIRINQYKMKQPKNNKNFLNKNNSFLFSTENKAVESIGLFIAIVSVVLLAFFTTFKVNSLSSVEINIFPNNIFVNYYHLINPIIVCGFGSIIYFLKHEKMKRSILKELKIMLCRMKIYSNCDWHCIILMFDIFSNQHINCFQMSFLYYFLSKYST